MPIHDTGFSWQLLRLHQAQQVLAENLDIPLRILRLDALDRLRSVVSPRSLKAIESYLEMPSPPGILEEIVSRELWPTLAPIDPEKEGKISEALWITPQSAPNPFYDELKTIIPGFRAKIRLHLLWALKRLLSDEGGDALMLKLPFSLVAILHPIMYSFESLEKNLGIVVVGPARLLQDMNESGETSPKRFIELEREIAKGLETLDSKTLTIEDRTNILVLSSAYVSYSYLDLYQKAEAVNRSLCWVLRLEDQYPSRLKKLTTAEWCKAIQFMFFWLSKRSWPLLSQYIQSQNAKVESSTSMERAPQYRVEACLSSPSETHKSVAIRMTGTFSSAATREIPYDNKFTIVDNVTWIAPETLRFEIDKGTIPIDSQNTLNYFFHRSLEDGHANLAWQEYLSFDRLRHRLQHLRVDDLPNRQALFTGRARELVNADIAVYFYFHSLENQLRVETGSIITAQWVKRSDISRLREWLRETSQSLNDRKRSAVYRCLDTRTYQSRLKITVSRRPFADGWIETADHMPIDGKVWGIVPTDFIAVPVQFHDRMLGVLYLASATPNRFRYYDRIRLLSFVRMFEAEIFEAKLFTILKEINEDLGESLRNDLPQTSFGDRLMRRIGFLLSVSCAVLWWRSSSKSDVFEVVGFSGRKSVPLRHGLEELVSSFGLSRAPDADGDEVTMDLRQEKFKTEWWPFPYSLGIPLTDIKNSRYLGMITIHDSSPIDVSRFLEDEVRFVRDQLRQNLDSFMEHRERLRTLRNLVGHDVNSALRHIDSIAKRLMPFQHQLVDEGQRIGFKTRLGDIEHNIKRARQLLDILTRESIQQELLSKREVGLVTFYEHLSANLSQPISVHKAFKVALHGRLRDLRSLLINFGFHGKYLPKLWIAEEAVEEIAANLVDNVVKYGARRTAISIEFDEDELEYFVHFESIGQHLREELRKQPDDVFKPGVRGIESSMVNKVPGTGQGLFVSREIAKVWDGSLNLRYQHEIYRAVFRFTLSFPRWLAESSNPWRRR